MKVRSGPVFHPKKGQPGPRPVQTAHPYSVDRTEPCKTGSGRSGCGSPTGPNRSHLGPVGTSLDRSFLQSTLLLYTKYCNWLETSHLEPLPSSLPCPLLQFMSLATTVACRSLSLNNY